MPREHYLAATNGSHIYESWKMMGQVNELIAAADAKQPKWRKSFDAYLVRGSSGLLAAPLFSLATGHPITVARKVGESSHHGDTSGARPTQRFSDEPDAVGIYQPLPMEPLRYCFLDDFTDSGRTFWDCADRVEVEREWGKVTVMILYRGSYYGTRSNLADCNEQKDDRLKEIEYLICMESDGEGSSIYRHPFRSEGEAPLYSEKARQAKSIPIHRFDSTVFIEELKKMRPFTDQLVPYLTDRSAWFYDITVAE